MTTLIDYLAEFYGTNNLFLYKKINQSSKDWIVYKTTAKLLVCEIVVSFNPLIHREPFLDYPSIIRRAEKERKCI